MYYLSHPTGNQNSREAVLALSSAGLLDAFATAVHFDPRSPLVDMLPLAVKAEISRRNFSDYAGNSGIYSYSIIREIVRAVATKCGIDWLTRHEDGWASIDKIYRSVDVSVARLIAKGKSSVSGVYCYEDGALETFKAAKSFGARTVYELPIGYWRTHRRLCEEEAQRSPSWAHTWVASKDSEGKVQRKDREIYLASRLVVPSPFVAESLREYPHTLPPISVVPYGCPDPIKAVSRNWYSGGTLKILFVGALSQRKGLKYLLEAVRPLAGSVSLTIIGTGSGRELIDSCHRLLGSMPNSSVLSEMRKHDIFVFPTLFEGYGLVVTEAFAQGMPVITTPCAGPAAMIENGIHGWVVPVCDAQSITERLTECIIKPDLVESMGRSVLKLAAKWTWADYRKCLVDTIIAGDD